MKLNKYYLACSTIMAFFFIISYFCSGGGPRHELGGDAAHYNSHTVSIIHNQQFAPETISTEEMDKISELGGPSPAYANEGYIFFRSIFSLVAGNTRIWHASLISLICLIIAWPFFLDFAANFVSNRSLMILSTAVAIYPSWMRQIIRPLTDPVFTAVILIVIWFIHKYREKTIQTGLILGIAMVIRVQAAFLLVFLPILIVREFSFKAIFKSYLKLSLGFVIPIVMVSLIKQTILTMPEAADTVDNWYINYLVNDWAFSDPAQLMGFVLLSLWHMKINIAFTALFLIHCFPKYYRTQNSFLTRLGLFIIGNILLLLIIGCSNGKVLVFRYLLCYIPFAILISLSTYSKFVSSKNIGAIVLTLYVLLVAGAQGKWLLNFSPKLERYEYSLLEEKLAQLPKESVILTNNIYSLQTGWYGRKIVRITDKTDPTTLASQLIDCIVIFQGENDDGFETYRKLLKRINVPVFYFPLNT